MLTTTTALRSVLNCLVGALAAVAFAAGAAAPPPPPAPPAKPVVKKPHIPYQGAIQGDVSEAYGFRTRILTGTPGCQRFATESDAIFLDDKMDDQTKVGRLNSIGADAAASGCLMP